MAEYTQEQIDFINFQIQEENKMKQIAGINRRYQLQIKSLEDLRDAEIKSVRES